MMPASYAQAYEYFAQQLEQLERQVTVAQPDVAQIKAALVPIQQEFQHTVQPLVLEPDEAVPRTVISRLTACNTEINKHLRFLAMDISFLQAARQPQTVQQRQAQIRDRLQRLITYARLELG